MRIGKSRVSRVFSACAACGYRLSDRTVRVRKKTERTPPLHDTKKRDGSIPSVPNPYAFHFRRSYCFGAENWNRIAARLAV